MSTMVSWIPLTTLAFALSCNAFRLPPHSRDILAKRDQSLNNIILTNAEQTLIYSVGQFGSGQQEITSILDTISGDILVPSSYSDSLTGFTSQGKSVSAGQITSGSVTVLDWNVPDQDIVIFESATLTEYAYLGLGTNQQSQVDAQFSDWSSASFIPRLLGESPNNTYFTILFSPSPEDYGTDMSFGGIFTIGEIVDFNEVFNATLDSPIEMSEILSRPALQLNGQREFAISGLTGPQGPITLSGNTTAYIDTTSSSILVNPEVAEAIYGKVSSSHYSSSDGLWYLPCTQINVTFTISGYDFPISPLNMLRPTNDSCVGTFQSNLESSSAEEFVFGIPFLNEAYALFGYNQWQVAGSGSGGVVSDPYVKLLSIAIVEEFDDDWVQNGWQPLNGGSSSGSSSSSDVPSSSSVSSTLASTPVSSLTSTPVFSSASTPVSSPPSTVTLTSTVPVQSSTVPAPSSTVSSSGDKDLLSDGDISENLSDSDSDDVGDRVRRYLPAIIIGAVFVLALMGVGIWLCCRRRGGRDGKGSYKGLQAGGAASTVHVPLYGAEDGHGKYTDPYKDE